ncbi:unnamed protein product [Heligmosomoides polygyrus]|uniref:Peptidase A1 domain-containing protein n=1 Tax=Heligmosomoides polygyrus TaxID=6339 RepID=A0A183FB38_HELPZ|nr:unnamed protein product [Heligmosomoides polygyrus]
MQQAVFSDIYSNFAIVPFPNASLYTIGGGIQDFGSLQIADFPFAFQMMFSYYPFLNGVDSDIQRYRNSI